MAKHPTHYKICKRVLGQSFPKVDKAIDWPVRILGPTHRIWFHSIPTAFIIGILTTGTVIGGLAGLVHLAVDLLSDIYHKILRLLK